MNRRDLASGLFWLAIGIFVLTQALELGVGAFSTPGAGFMLFWTSIIFGILSIILIVKAVVRSDAKKGIAELWYGVTWANVVIAVIALALYAVFLVKLGFMLSTIGFMIVLYWVGKMKPWVVVGGAVFTVVLTYVIFHYALQIQFPRGPFGW
jgi:hypothetical protein